jgi:ketosteroid isomerase-like protein
MGLRRGGRALGAFALAAATCSTVSATEPGEAIRNAIADWTKAFNSHEAGRVCALFSRDLVADYQGQPERSYEELCRLLSDSLKDPEKSYRYAADVREVLVSGRLAVVRLVWTLHVSRKDGRPVETVKEPGIDVFRLEPDGSWKIFRYLAYPMPTSR